MSQLKESLREMDIDHEEGTSLAAVVAKAWASFLADVSLLVFLLGRTLVSAANSNLKVHMLITGHPSY